MCDKNLVLSLTVLGVGEGWEREEERWNAFLCPVIPEYWVLEGPLNY